MSVFSREPDTGDVVPLPPGVLGCELKPVDVVAVVVRVARAASCCVAREERVAGDGTGFAVSSERGRGLDRAGIEKVLASAARDGKFDADKDPEDIGESGDDATKSLIASVGTGGEGVLGGGG